MFILFKKLLISTITLYPRFILLFYFITVPTAYGNMSYEKRKLIEDTLEKSALNHHYLPTLKASSIQELIGISTEYDPVLFSVLSAITSQAPDKNEDDWLQVELPPNKYSVTCPNNIRAIFKPSRSNSPYTFVIMPGAYTPIDRGSYINQISDILTRHFQDPNIIAFAGFFHPDFLEGSCTSIPWDNPSMAKDFYFRLSKFLEEISADPKHTGLIGISLGASFTFMTMGYDTEKARKEDSENVFGLGGFSISPPLHAIISYLNLDRKYQNTTIDPSDSFTAVSIWNFIPKAFGFVWYGLLDEAKDIVDYYESDRNQFINRTYNEFTVINLKNLLSTIDPNRDINLEEISYYKTFTKEGFIRSMNFNPDRLRTLLQSIDLNSPDIVRLPDGSWKLSDQHNRITCDKPTDCIIRFCETTDDPCPFSIQNLYNKALDMRPFLVSLDRPLFLYLSQDDPVLYPQDEQGQPPMAIADVLNTASQNENTIIFHPKYGGHSGLFLDPNFEKLIVDFFKP